MAPHAIMTFIATGCTNELCRLRLNFAVLMILLFVSLLSFDGTLPTIHQYVTNPTEQEMNRTATVTQHNYEVCRQL